MDCMDAPVALLLRGIEITLRPLDAADAASMAAAAAESREAYDYNPVPSGLEESRRYIEQALRQRASGRRIPFAILWRGRLVGTTSYSEFQPWEWPPGNPLQRVDSPDAVEIGHTWLAQSAQRTRCNTEAKYLLLEHAFETWCVHRVALRTDERNERSRRAIARLGAQFEGIRRADKPGQDGSVRNSAMFSIVEAEWPTVRAALKARLARP